MKILYLTLTKEPFETMETGLKDKEYREPSAWIRSRLIDKKTGNPKHYDVVLFRNGYEMNKPYFAATYLGFENAQKNYSVKYTNGFKVDVKKGYFRIKLGAIIKRGNILDKELF